jgi:hypothetical protein
MGLLKEKTMRWIFLIIAALILLPLAWKLLTFATGLALTLLQLAAFLLVVVFLVGLVRRMLLLR